MGFLGELLSSAKTVKCCMDAWAEHVGDWSDYHGSYTWHKLIDAAEAVYFEWPSEAHRALADALACRAVWLYLVDPIERQRVDAITQNKTAEKKAEAALRMLDRKERLRWNLKSKFIGSFIDNWWLRRYGSNSHWARNCRLSEVEEELANIFFGKSLASLDLESRFETIYRNRHLIPSHLKPISHFHSEKWYQAELNPCAAYIGKKRAWLLYDTAEKERIKSIYPLRFAYPSLNDTEVLLTKTQLKKAGLSDDKIAELTPVSERQNPHNLQWYFLYKVEMLSL